MSTESSRQFIEQYIAALSGSDKSPELVAQFVTDDSLRRHIEDFEKSFPGYDLEVDGEEATEHPQMFVAITVEHVIAGDVDPEAVRRSIELSATRYCPVSALLSKGVTIEHRYRLTRRDGTEHAALVVVTGPGDAPKA